MEKKMKKKLMIFGVILGISINTWGMDQTPPENYQDSNNANNVGEITPTVSDLEELFPFPYADEYFDPNSDSNITLRNLSNYFNSDTQNPQ